MSEQHPLARRLGLRGAVRAPNGPAIYRERLSAPPWWYPVAVLIAVILAGEFHVADESLTIIVPVIAIVALGIAIVWSVGRSWVSVTGGELWIRDAHIPVSAIGDVVPLDRQTVRLVVSRHGDPAASHSVRPWIGPAVQFGVIDPDDPTPYWVVSTRHPQRLADAIRAEQRR